MKPNFALTLSFEGIGLLHRAFPGWHLVGEIDLDNDNLRADLAALHDRATALDPSGLLSKLVIPNDQIKYLSFEAGGTEDEDLPALVKEQLDGATPYGIDDLEYDWSLDGDTVKVAAVARETLREAEAFAREHRFNPISFVAVPKNDDFAGEPFFGETSLARELATNGEAVENDPVPVRVIGTAPLPDNPVVEHLPETENIADDGTEPAPALEAEEQTIEFVHEPVEGFGEPQTTYEDPVTADVDKTAANPVSPDRQATAFSSIRAQRGAAPATAPKLDGVARHITPVPVSAKVNADSLPGDPVSESVAPEPERELAPPPVEHEPPAPRIPVAPPDPEPVAPTDHNAFTSRRIAPVKATPRPRPVEPTLEEQQRMTIFGARDAEPIGGKPKYLGLILTAVLLLFLVGVAAWASIFLDDGLSRFFGSEPEVRTADVPLVPKPEPDPVPEAETSETVVDSLPQPSDEEEEALREVLSQPEPVDLTEDEIRARYAATGIWMVAPQTPSAPSADTLDTFYQTSIDREVVIQDAIALPDPDSFLADERPQTLNSPTRPGTTFELDDRGLVVATAAGALTPEGIRIFAGTPPVKPPAMPKREIVQEVVTPEDPAALKLAAFRPMTRPENLSEQAERGTLSGRTRLELAALRPKLRPQSAQQAAELAARQAAADSPETQPFIDLDAVNSAVTEAVESDVDFADAMPQAVAVSLKPTRRPKNLADRVNNRRTGDQQAALAVSATQRVAPRIPTTTSVAKQATQRNVLKLRKINLIGVYGTPNSRRALVRLANGRYRKVKVGDRLDGGKVSAIGDSELRYRKSGRNVVLKMPRG